MYPNRASEHPTSLGAEGQEQWGDMRLCSKYALLDWFSSQLVFLEKLESRVEERLIHLRRK